MKKTKEKLLIKKRKRELEFKKAESDYKKTISDMDPFIPKPKSVEVTTEGKWQTTASIIFNQAGLR